MCRRPRQGGGVEGVLVVVGRMVVGGQAQLELVANAEFGQVARANPVDLFTAVAAPVGGEGH